MTETSVATVSARTDGLLEYRCTAGAHVTLADARLVLDTARQVAPHLPCATLVLIGRVARVDRDARDFFASRESNEITSRAAVVTNSRLGAMVANVFMGISQPEFPTRIFTSADAAVAWLRNP